MKFIVTNLSTGVSDEATSETTSADAYAMERWGRDSAAQVESDCGIRIEPVTETAATDENEEKNVDDEDTKPPKTPAPEEEHPLERLPEELIPDEAK
jgi:hypothetical protein